MFNPIYETDSESWPYILNISSGYMWINVEKVKKDGFFVILSQRTSGWLYRKIVFIRVESRQYWKNKITKYSHFCAPDEWPESDHKRVFRCLWISLCTLDFRWLDSHLRFLVCDLRNILELFHKICSFASEVKTYIIWKISHCFIELWIRFIFYFFCFVEE